MTGRFEADESISRRAVFVAVVLSIGFHFALFSVNPSLRFIGAPGVQAPARVREYSRLTLDRLEERPDIPLPLDLDTLIQRSGEEGPEESFSEAGVEDVEPFLTDAIPDVPMPGPDPLRLDTGRLPKPDRPEAVDWTPRAEVLAIREPRVAERIDAAPRRIVALEAREIDVRDSLDMVEDLIGKEEAGGGEAALSGNPIFASGSAADSPGSLRMGTMEEVPIFEDGTETGGRYVPEVSERLFEEGDDMILEAGMKIADQFLRVSAQTYVDPSRPEYRYFKIQLRPSQREETPIFSKEVLLLLDASSRVSPETYRQAGQAVADVLGALNPDDLFNLFLLQENVQPLFEESQKATPINLARARGRLAGTQPRGGGDLFSGLSRLLVPAPKPDRVRIGLVITDGIPSMSVEDSAEQIEHFTRKNSGIASVFTIGAGRRVNRYLLDFLSFQNRGDSLVTEQTVQIEEALFRMLDGVQRPVLRDLRYRFAGDGRLRVYPRALTHLYLDRPLLLVGRMPAEQETMTFQIVGDAVEGSQNMLYTLPVNQIPPGPWSLRQDWAWQAMLDEVGHYLQTGDLESRRRIFELAQVYGIGVPYAIRSEHPRDFHQNQTK